MCQQGMSGGCPPAPALSLPLLLLCCSAAPALPLLLLLLLPSHCCCFSRGNCHASLGEWRAARTDYLSSAREFQGAAGFRGRGGSMTPRLDGAVFAASNAALMLAQLGDEAGAIKEMQVWM